MRIILFSKALKGTIDGTMNKEFVHKNRTRYDQFKTEILNTAPDLLGQNPPPPNVGPAMPGPITVELVREVIRRSVPIHGALGRSLMPAVTVLAISPGSFLGMSLSTPRRTSSSAMFSTGRPP